MECVRNPVLASLSDPARSALLRRALPRRLDRGTILFLTGDAPERLYLVMRGLVKLAARGSDGRELILGLALADDLVGEIAAFEGRPYEVDAIAVTACRALVFDASAFRRAAEREPEALKNLVRGAANRYRAMTAAVQERTITTVPSRLAGRLLHFAHLLGEDGNETIEFELPLRQADIASLIGTSRETISKTMKKFEKEGLVQCRGRKLRILRPDALNRIRCATRA